MVLSPQGFHAHPLPCAWNCPLNEKRVPPRPTCKYCRQSVVPPEKTHVDSLTFRLMMDFFFFILDAEEYQPPIWKSYREYLKWKSPQKSLAGQPFWTILASDVVHTSVPTSQHWKLKSFFPLRKKISQRGLTEPPPLTRGSKNQLWPISEMLGKDRWTFWLSAFQFGALFLFIFLYRWLASDNVLISVNYVFGQSF